MYDLLFSLTIHANPQFIIEQIKNISYYCDNLKVCIIYNCNQYMYNILSKEDLNNNENVMVIIHPIPFEKARFSGSLLKSIFENIQYIINNKIQFKHFITFSSRYIFKKKVCLQDIECTYEKIFQQMTCLKKKDNIFVGIIDDNYDIIQCPQWKHVSFHEKINIHHSYLKEFMEKNKQIVICEYGSNYIIPYNIIVKINNFSKNNHDLMEKCYISKQMVHPMEEW